jgi:uroporphyrinogen decarboxylase
MRTRERTLLALSHHATDRLLFDRIGSTESREVAAIVESLDLPGELRTLYLEGDFEYLMFASHEDRERFGSYLPGLPEEAAISDWGVGTIPLKTAEGFHAGHKTFHPLARVDSTAELERYPFPDFTQAWRHADLDEKVRKAKEQGYVVVGQMSQTILETAYLMRGIERLFVDLHERPDYVATLFERIAERQRFQARRFAEAGVDVLRIGDDIANQRSLLVSPALYRKQIKPFHASVVAAARSINPSIHVLYHSDGNLTALLPDLIEVGVTAINPVQPECMDLIGIKREFGRDLTLWGCGPVQSTYAFGTREDVLAHVRLLKGELSVDGGLVVQFYNMILTPKVKENLAFFFDSFFGNSSA